MAKAQNLVERHIQALKQFKGQSVEAGWFESARYKAEPPKSGEGGVAPAAVGTSIAFVMRVQEFGATIKRGNATIVIPARPFMRLAYQTFLKQRKPMQKRIADALLADKITADQALGQIGLALEGCIVDSIKNGGWESNAPSTVANKGFDKPLIDSAQAWQAVVSKVNP